ncbi:MAG: glycoside hydrolase family 125 protein, partial [Candidatus Gracilibacteria bacterium]
MDTQKVQKMRNSCRIYQFLIMLVLCFGAINIALAGSAVENFDKLALSDSDAQQTFQQSLPYTLKTTIKKEPDGTYYVITGTDLPFMWVRDSSAQLYPYVYMSKNDVMLQNIIRGTILRHMKHFNASVEDAPFINSWKDDYTPHEYKYEPDGVAYLIRLAWLYWKVTGDEKWAHMTGDFEAHQAFNHAVDVLKKHTGPTGMIKCKNRPSDDWTAYPYLIPTNMFLASMLPKLAEMYSKIWNDPVRAEECKTLSQNIKAGIAKYGIYHHPFYGDMWAYEVDGTQNGYVFLADDANVPSLLSAPYLEFSSSTDPVYQNTREFILNKKGLFNQYYFTGSYGEGVGSPHTQNDWVWPMSVILQAMTSVDESEIPLMLKYLNNFDKDKGAYYVHESVNPNDPTQYTRQSFAWGNALY